MSRLYCALVVLMVTLFATACQETKPPAKQPSDTPVDTPATPSAPTTTKTKTARMQEIEQLIVGDWIEDSVAFKRNYNMPPPLAKNTRVRYQEDGYVYIPGVLLNKSVWDRWEIVNDTTLHVIKRENAGIRVFVIDNISSDAIEYRIKLPQMERKVRLIPFTGTD